MRIVSALLAGPAWEPARSPKPNALAAVLPLLALATGACAVAAVALLPAAPGLARAAMRGCPWAAAGTLLCLAAALPAAIDRPGLFWMLPAWLAASVGPAGWSLMAVADAPSLKAVQVAGLLLPFMVLGLAGAISAVPGNLSEAAAASGAGPLATACLLTRAAWPGMLRVLVIAALGAAAVQGASIK